MPDMYKDAIERGQDKTFAIYQRFDGSRQTFTFNDIARESDNLITKLEKAGLRKGDRIGVVASLRPMWFALKYTCLRKGYIMVCIDPGVPASQMHKLMLDTDIRAVFTTLTKIHLPEEYDENIPVYSIYPDFPLMSKCNKVNPLLDNCKPLPEDTFFILFSSGTTSENRKAVLLPHTTVTGGIEYGMSKNAGTYKNYPAYSVKKRDLNLFPPYHIAGLLTLTFDFYCNTEIIMLERLTPNGLINALQDLKPDNICTVPSMLNSLYKKILAGYSNNFALKTLINSLLGISGFLRRNFDIKAGRVLLKSLNKKAFGGNMKSFMVGASPFDATPHKFFLDMGIDVTMAYGLTELGAPLTATGMGYYPGTSGRVLKHTEQLDVRIVKQDENGRGEVEVLSPFRMISYMNEKDNIGCFTEDGYYKTGDLGYFDKNKCLTICGRIKESIVLRNGEKLLPEEIENKYQGLDCVKDLTAFKVPGEGGCDDFAIAIIKDFDKGIPDAQMKVRVYERAEHLPPMYRPRDVYVLKEFPLSSTHKIQRFRLTEMVVNGSDEPITDASMLVIDEDETTAALRKILIEVAGSQWKTQKLTQGLLLNIDSLTTVNLFIAIQEKWHIDLFQTSEQPNTFGELLDIVKNYENIEKKQKDEIDLSKYPLPVSKLTKFASRNALKFIKLTWGVKASGLENIPKEGNFLLASNHRTVIDPAFILTCLDRKIVENTCTIGKAELANDKILKNFVVSQNYIPVDRTGNSIKTLERSKELLNEGYNILIFPEGTSVQNSEKIYPLKTGVAKLSIATDTPIIPVYIAGVAHDEKEINSFRLPSPKGKIRIRFGKPIYHEGKSVEELTNYLRDKLEELA